LVTYGIPTFNNGKYIEKSIESVLNQTFKDIELYVYDNASEDETEKNVQKYLNIPNFHYIRREKNEGALVNWNDCLLSGDGKYIAMLHADDMIRPRHVEELVGMLEKHKNCCLAYCPCIWIDEKDGFLQIVDHIGHRKLNYWGGRNELAELFVYDCYITASSVIFKRNIIEKVGVFDGKLSSDWSYFLRIAKENSNFCFSTNPTVEYRWHDAQQSNDYYKTNDPLIAHVSLLRDYLSQWGAKDKFKGYEDRVWTSLMNRCNQKPEGAFGLGFIIEEEIGKILKEMAEKE